MKSWYEMVNEKYRVKSGISQIEFFDLKIGPRSGKRNLKLVGGNYLPLEQLDETEFQKSLGEGGCLYRAIKSDWVIMETNNPNDYPIKKAETNDVMIEPGATMVTEKKQDVTTFDKDKNEQKQTVQSQFVSEQDINKAQNVNPINTPTNNQEKRKKGRGKQIINPNVEKEYLGYKNILSLEKKVEFINNCNNIELIYEIIKFSYKNELKKACEEKLKILKGGSNG